MSKSKKRLRKRYLILISGMLAIGYLTWPLASTDFHLQVDPESKAEKAAILQGIKPDSADRRPNVLLITVDDLGMADASLYGEGEIQTPHIDGLGSQGVVFENAYVTSPVCAPSRAALITGRYQHRFGFEYTMNERYLKNRLEYLGFRYFVQSHPWEPKWMDAVPDKEAIHQQGLPLTEITLAEVLKQKGYSTGIVGKWHLGWSEEKRPSAFGFDEQYGFFHSHSLYVPENTPGYVDQKIANDWTDPYIWKGQRNGHHAIHRNYEVIEEKEYLTDRITEESIHYMEKNKHKPFFLWTSYNAPHTPLQAPEEYVERFNHIEDPVKRVYQAMIASLDDNIGILMKYLEESGLDENILVFFISDNGGAEYTHTTDNGRYAGGKNTEFEGGLKVPMIVRWKGVVPSGKRYRPMVSSMDLFPTAANAAGASDLGTRPLDGVDLLPFLTDSLASQPHPYLFWQRGNSKVVRSSDWKLMINANMGDTLLYKLSSNPYENPDEFGDHPQVVNTLLNAYENWTGTHRPPLWPSLIYFIGEKDGKAYYFDQ